MMLGQQLTLTNPGEEFSVQCFDFFLMENVPLEVDITKCFQLSNLVVLQIWYLVLFQRSYKTNLL